jgi:hypothetical protein
MASKWVIHYYTLAPETVLVDQKYFGSPADYTVAGIEAALRAGDVQHVSANGSLQQGASYWALGAVREYELVETDEQDTLSGQHKVLLTQADLASAAAALVAAERAASAAADQVAVAEQALQLAVSAKASVQAEVDAAQAEGKSATDAIALASANAAKIIEAAKAENGDALQKLADVQSKLADAQSLEVQQQIKLVGLVEAAKQAENAKAEAAAALQSASLKAAEAQLSGASGGDASSTVTASAGAPEA